MTEQIKNALLEIGAEEIPASYIEPALKQIEEFAVKSFNNEGLKYGAIKTYATPRRLVLFVENLDSKSSDKTEEILGPSVQAAKDANGNFTQAAIGFASKNGTTPEKLTVKNSDKGDRLCFVKKTKGEKTEILLSNIFPEIIKNIHFPKNMVWEESGFKFARPVRNIIALYGKKVIKFKIAGVKSDNWTIGLHAIDKSRIKIDLPENYLVKMKNKLVISDQNERKEAIKKSVNETVKTVGSVIEDESLVDEINYLVEYPTAVLCEFDKKYLDLPPEALTVCIKKSQKCFAVLDKQGIFSNYFIDVKNGISEYQEIAREGYEKVVGARLADAEFFYKNDLKKGLEGNIEKLKGIVFHKEIGTIYEKVERVNKITQLINKEFNLGINADDLEKAVMLSKADLVSEMVFEYGELQGVMGKIYARKSGIKDEVADAIEQHYWPISASGKLPENRIALLISLADKIDSLSANFSIGLEPSGSADPYALRRAGIALIRMIKENFPKDSVASIVEKSFEFLPEKVKANPKAKDAHQRLFNFFWQRIESILESQGYEHGEIKAITNAAKTEKLRSFGTLEPKIESLRNAKTKGDFAAISEVFKRINNILAQAKKQNIEIPADVNEALLSDEAEKALYVESKSVKTEVDKYLSQNEYNAVFDKVLELKPYIDSFFEKVMVMAEDESIKKNRIALLNSVKNIFAGFVDFSALQ
ncbi:MAG: glycine--tRNA ligase subunit beta [Endomicrobia bacterium]|nr:glycine--tRNA ligase subunit beta [Endomicrobiia bacterium]MCL2507074.1 glycine--tRNA ligase subunit beta [Endomicrobiia bacterium]